MIYTEKTYKQIKIGIVLIVIFIGAGIGFNMNSNKLVIGSTITGSDGMILLYVPAGEFLMGSDDGDPYEQPVHKVNLNAFWIDQTEVTNKMYSLCVTTNICKEPINKSSFTHLRYYGNPEFDYYPVIYVDWTMAKTYCESVGRRLPSEAEWEKAARGVEGHTYPWGLEVINETYANYNNKHHDTTVAGHYDKGKSQYGAYDMAGNVWEWGNDWYDASYYQVSPLSNPLGPDSGDARVLKGGSWNYDEYDVRSSGRNSSVPSDTYYNIGFRCALSS